MKWLKYQMRTQETTTDDNGLEKVREFFHTVLVPDNENGRALAAQEAHNGEVEAYEDDEPYKAETYLTEERLNQLEERIRVFSSSIELLLKRIGIG